MGNPDSGVRLMALNTAEGTALIRLDVLGDLSELDVRDAVVRGQRKNAVRLEAEVKARAQLLIDANASARQFEVPGRSRERGPQDAGRSMVDAYRTDVRGTDLIADNPTARADYFEFGTDPHVIRASGLTEFGQGDLPRGTRRDRDADGRVTRVRPGQFTRGARSLRFVSGRSGQVTFRAEVNHPGQRATHVLEDTMDSLLDEFAETIADEIVEEFGIRG